jgi:hypothetical protein
MEDFEIDETMPLYLQMNPHGFYADDTLFPEGTKLYFMGEPNEYLKPLNGIARMKVKEYFAKLDAEWAKYCEKQGKQLTRRPVDFADVVAELSTDARAQVANQARTVMVAEKPQKGMQGHLNADGSLRRKPGRPPKTKVAAMPSVKAPVGEKPVQILGSNFEQSLSVRG